MYVYAPRYDVIVRFKLKKKTANTLQDRSTDEKFEGLINIDFRY